MTIPVSEVTTILKAKQVVLVWKRLSNPMRKVTFSKKIQVVLVFMQ